eukprot:TRINITY_DN8760_c0_g1_i4.p1 TRINITY_DN8760_c0_g1~~TRINITY_DN8760_c0_g1_i4.p1  ORF type:complete len:126 (+),score=19.46 TRINITY_DN8760_c0_g1_i4:179-556(+)
MSTGGLSPSQGSLEEARAVLGSMMSDQHQHRRAVHEISHERRAAQDVAKQLDRVHQAEVSSLARAEASGVLAGCEARDMATEYWAQQRTRDPYFQRPLSGSLVCLAQPWSTQPNPTPSWRHRYEH